MGTGVLTRTHTPRPILRGRAAALVSCMFFFFQAEDGIRDVAVTGVQTCALPISVPQQFLALAIANALVAIYIFTIVPEFLMRFLSWLMVRTLYRLRPPGREANVPDEGAALLVCNHVSYMDALILSATIPRPVRFVMYYRIFNIPVMRWIFRTAKAIPIAGAREIGRASCRER